MFTVVRTKRAWLDSRKPGQMGIDGNTGQGEDGGGENMS